MKCESHYMLDENKILHENILYRFNVQKFIFSMVSVISIALLGYAVFATIMPALQKADEGKDDLITVEVHETVASEVITEEITVTDSSEQLFAKRCSTEYLTKNDFYNICGESEDLGEKLQYYINYIYARNGHAFQKGGEVDCLFQEQSWYREITEKRSVTYEDLNPYEKWNVDVMVKILKNNGYR